MATGEIDDLISQARPTKRVRLDNESSNIDSTPPIDDMDDFYSAEHKPAVSASVPEASVQNTSATKTTLPAYSGIPGLGRLGNAPTAPAKATEVPAESTFPEEMRATPVTEDPNTEMSGMEGAAITAIKVLPSFSNSVNQPAPPYPESQPLAIVPTSNTMPPSSNNSESLPPAHEENHPATDPTSHPATPQESQPVTHALEALLGGLDSSAPKDPDSESPRATEEEPAAGEHPEWEVDSSPIESSSDDSSSDDSSSEEDSDDEDNAYKLLSPEEQARILMDGDGGSDDEGGATKAKGAGGQLRTKNEIPEEIVPKPDVAITPEMRMEELGVVETIVENIILIKAKTSGEYRALESGSVLCLENRSVIGVVSETLGRVQQPLYTVRFTNAGEITEAGISLGMKVFYPEEHAKYALTQVLKAYKGSDASNLHDEEVGDEEMEFSDDEAEAEHKRRLKHKKLERRGGKMQQNGGSGRGGHAHPLQQQHSPPNGGGGLSYDDAEDDGPYKPLARPTGFADTVGRSEAPQEGAYMPGMLNHVGRGDFRGRGRGDRGRGRGGRGRGGYQDRRESSGYSQPPQNRPNTGYGPPQQSPPVHPSFNPQGAGFPQSPVVPPSPNNFYQPQQDQYNPLQPPVWPQFPQQPFQQPYQGFPSMQNGWPNMPQPPPLSSGAFINPAFFAGSQPAAPTNQWNQQQAQQGGRGRGSSS